jgi:hypothetical protein
MKKTLLIAAAALVAGIVTSEAQVYSANVVGYVNTIQTNQVFYMCNNPLDNGTNSLVSLFPGVPSATVVEVFSAGTFTTYKFTAGHWKIGATIYDTTVLPVGSGYFIEPGGAAPYTNTFVGNIVCPAGGSVTNAVGSGFQLVGSQIPYGDAVTNTATLNVPGAAAFQIQKWNVGSQGFTTYKFAAGAWKIGNTVSIPQIGVGEGFFYSTSGTNWVETLP